MVWTDTVQVIYYTEDRRKLTGIIAEVLPFGTKNISIVVRPQCVILEGSLYINPEMTRMFGRAVMIAAAVAEGTYVRTSNNSTSDT
jgi:hypothetical protein